MSIRLHHLEITTDQFVAPEKGNIIQIDPDWLLECLGDLALQMDQKYPDDHNLVMTKFPLRVQDEI